jgi:hypothetical protein
MTTPVRNQAVRLVVNQAAKYVAGLMGMQNTGRSAVE